jgi:hypothetical protein
MIYAPKRPQRKRPASAVGTTVPLLWLLVVFLISACASSAGPTTNPAAVDTEHVKAAIATAQRIGERIGKTAPIGTAWFEVKRGPSPAIVTAPHATRPFRDGEYRFADGAGTAALANALHSICGVNIIYTTFDSPSDPNFYDDNQFKVALAALIAELRPALLLDIHASNASRPYDVDIGTMNGASLVGRGSLVKELSIALRDEGVSNISHNWFSASKNQTIAKFASARGVPSLQLEINVSHVSPAANDEAARRFTRALQGLVGFLGTQGACERKR